MQELKVMKPYFKKYKKWILFGTLFIFLEVMMDLFAPTILASMVEKGIGESSSTYLWQGAFLMLFLTLLGILGAVLSSYFSSKAACYISYELRSSLFEKLTTLSFSSLDQISKGKMTTILSNDLNVVQTVILYSIRMLFRVPVIFIGSIIMAIFVCPSLASIFIVILPCMAFLVAVLFRKAFPYFDATQQATDQVNQFIRENISGIRVVKTMNQEEFEKQKFALKNEALQKINMKAMNTITMVTPIMMGFIYLATIGILYRSHFMVPDTLAVGSVMAFLQYLTTILSTLLVGAMMFLLIARSQVSIKRMGEVLMIPKEEKKGHLKRNLQGKITFEDVSFEYHEGVGDDVLTHLSFTIEPGQKVAIVGKTGSGKSSLLYLLGRYYEPKNGRILLDDLDITQFDLKNLRKQVILDFQKMTLFHGTIASNIAFQKKQIDPKLLKFSKVDRLLKNQKTLQSKVEVAGKNLSGGEKNRLSYARALYKNPKILLLDDSFRAVDFKNQAQMWDDLQKHYVQTTVLYATNRFTHLALMDKVIFLEDGQIKGFDSHENLLKNNSLYQEFYQTYQEEW